MLQTAADAVYFFLSREEGHISRHFSQGFKCKLSLNQHISIHLVFYPLKPNSLVSLEGYKFFAAPSVYSAVTSSGSCSLHASSPPPCAVKELSAICKPSEAWFHRSSYDHAVFVLQPLKLSTPPFDSVRKSPFCDPTEITAMKKNLGLLEP